MSYNFTGTFTGRSENFYLGLSFMPLWYYNENHSQASSLDHSLSQAEKVERDTIMASIHYGSPLGIYCGWMREGKQNEIYSPIQMSMALKATLNRLYEKI